MIAKKKRLIVGFVAAILFSATAVFTFNQPATVQAQAVFKSNDTISQSETVNGSFYGAGSTVQVADNVDGDVWVGGQTVTVTGDITGDVIAAGQTVTISGKVSGDIRVMAQTLIITGQIDGSVSALAQSLSITNSATVNRDVSFVSQSVTVDGAVNRDIQGVVESLSISGKVGRDIHYVSDATLYQSSDASVGGEISQTIAKVDKPAQSSQLTNLVFTLLSVGFAVLVVSMLLHRWVRTATDAVFEHPGKVALAGLSSLLIPLVAILSLITIVGSIVGTALLLAYGLLIILGLVFTSYLIGRLIFRNTQPTAVQGFAGAMIYTILLFIPYVGFISWILGSLIGTGIIMLDITRRITSQPPTKKVVKATTKKSIDEK